MSLYISTELKDGSTVPLYGRFLTQEEKEKLGYTDPEDQIKAFMVLIVGGTDWIVRTEPETANENIKPVDAA